MILLLLGSSLLFAQAPSTALEKAVPQAAASGATSTTPAANETKTNETKTNETKTDETKTNETKTDDRATITFLESKGLVLDNTVLWPGAPSSVRFTLHADGLTTLDPTTLILAAPPMTLGDRQIPVEASLEADPAQEGDAKRAGTTEAAVTSTSALKLVVTGDLPPGEARTTILVRSPGQTTAAAVPLTVRTRLHWVWLILVGLAGGSIQAIRKVFLPAIDRASAMQPELRKLARALKRADSRQDAAFRAVCSELSRDLHALDAHPVLANLASDATPRLVALAADLDAANVDLDARRGAVRKLADPLLPAVGLLDSLPKGPPVAAVASTLQELVGKLRVDNVSAALEAVSRLEAVELPALLGWLHDWAETTRADLAPLASEGLLPPGPTRDAVNATSQRLTALRQAGPDLITALISAVDAHRELNTTLIAVKWSIESTYQEVRMHLATKGVAQLPPPPDARTGRSEVARLVAEASALRHQVQSWISSSTNQAADINARAAALAAEGRHMSAIRVATGEQLPPSGETPVPPKDQAEQPAAAAATSPRPTAPPTDVTPSEPCGVSEFVSTSPNGVLIEVGLSLSLLMLATWTTWVGSFYGTPENIVQVLAFGLGAQLGLDGMVGWLSSRTAQAAGTSKDQSKPNGAQAGGANGKPENTATTTPAPATTTPAPATTTPAPATTTPAPATTTPAPAADVINPPPNNGDDAMTDWDQLGAEEANAGPLTEPGTAPEAAGQVFTSSQVRWAADVDSVDYSHLISDQTGLPEPLSAAPFALNASALERLAEANRFKLPSTGKVLFGLRGCLPATEPDGVFAAAVQLREVVPDHRQVRCTLGVWDRDTGQLVVFRGSTVPNAKHIASYANDPQKGCNMRLCGFYRFTVGQHTPPSSALPGAFRQGEVIGVLRSRKDVTYTIKDPVLELTTSDNLHCTYASQGGESAVFASAGCLTVAGSWSRTSREHTDPVENVGWATFRERAGLSPRKYTTNNTETETQPKYGTVFQFLLLTGREARLAASGRTFPRLRFGSQGDEVKALQKHLGLPETGVFDARTLDVVTTQQARTRGSRNGVVAKGDFPLAIL